MHDLLDPIGTKLRGQTLVNLTSGTSAQAREAGEWAQQRDAHYLAGTIMAIPSAIGADAAVLLHSGPRSDSESHRTTLDALGTVTHLGADHGLASLYDAVGLGIMWSVLNGFSHANGADHGGPVGGPRSATRSRPLRSLQFAELSPPPHGEPSGGRTQQGAHIPMSNDNADTSAVSQLLAAYISVWNERDQQARRAILADVCTADAVYVDPTITAEGRTAIDAYVEGWQKQSPGMVFRFGEVRSHHDLAHFRWSFGRSIGSPEASGWDAVVLAHGHISRVYGFFD
ncbi:nuclear transport factor 2 family protein [Streptomyces sp. H27-C3]|uniref:nuclear transport factor 2 family protein n=1 Tax=Streptomyces sp. H27-C3 TaxID=3046305 RepID=UPI0024BA3041|nr:nuclear transport factor 2 family protein [Streptomyces sp. H27-C3]MDJ0467117.1 nuclear transport factor 2 family protein [Streptomyces sp. H27-C3]